MVGGIVQQFRELARIDDVRLRTRLPNQFHLVGIRDVCRVPASCNRATSHSQYSVASIAITTGCGRTASQSSTVSMVVAS